MNTANFPCFDMGLDGMTIRVDGTKAAAVTREKK
jgi:hypothetical protein